MIWVHLEACESTRTDGCQKYAKRPIFIFRPILNKFFLLLQMSCRWYFLRLSAYQSYVNDQQRIQRRGVARANGQAIMVFTVESDGSLGAGDGRNVRQCAAVPLHEFKKGNCLKYHRCFSTLTACSTA